MNSVGEKKRLLTHDGKVELVDIMDYNESEVKDDTHVNRHSKPEISFRLKEVKYA
jgi:hypothetical protein